MYTNKASTGRGRLQLYLSLPDFLSLARSLARSLSFFLSEPLSLHKTCASPPGLPDATITSAGPAGESCVNVDAG